MLVVERQGGWERHGALSQTALSGGSNNNEAGGGEAGRVGRSWGSVGSSASTAGGGRAVGGGAGIEVATTGRNLVVRGQETMGTGLSCLRAGGRGQQQQPS